MLGTTLGLLAKFSQKASDTGACADLLLAFSVIIRALLTRLTESRKLYLHFLFNKI
jgi:hypothetical protein